MEVLLHGFHLLDSAVEPREEADFLTASVLGVFVMLRAKAPPNAIKRAIGIAINHLEALRAGTST